MSPFGIALVKNSQDRQKWYGSVNLIIIMEICRKRQRHRWRRRWERSPKLDTQMRPHCGHATVEVGSGLLSLRAWCFWSVKVIPSSKIWKTLLKVKQTVPENLNVMVFAIDWKTSMIEMNICQTHKEHYNYTILSQYITITHSLNSH